jgi:hypothetical protein
VHEEDHVDHHGGDYFSLHGGYICS